MSCVIGVPDPIKVQKVKAFVVLKKGYSPNENVKSAIMEYCKKHIAKYALPYDIEFRDDLPKTLVGKVAYRVLEEEELAKIEKEKNLAMEREDAQKVLDERLKAEAEAEKAKQEAKAAAEKAARAAKAEEQRMEAGKNWNKFTDDVKKAFTPKDTGEKVEEKPEASEENEETE